MTKSKTNLAIDESDKKPVTRDKKPISKISYPNSNEVFNNAMSGQTQI